MDNTGCCEMPDSNPVDPEVRDVLGRCKRIAVVGLSDNPERESYKVAKYMMDNGYEIIPVNPSKKEILGKKCYPDIASVPGKIDIVDVFRRIEAVPGVVQEAIEIKPDVIWLQLGLAHRVSAEKARAAGIIFIQSRCLKIEHFRLFRER